MVLLFLAVRKISKKEKVMIDLLRDASTKDSLTSIANRRVLDDSIKEIHNNLLEENLSYTLLLIDIDFFKMVNDKFGHIIGDRVLIEMTKLFRLHIRGHDILGRWGGEEFLVILPATIEEAGCIVAEKIRQIVSEYRFDEVGYVTISCGVYGVKKEDSIDNAIMKVDQALYLAKNSGRNRVCRVE